MCIFNTMKNLLSSLCAITLLLTACTSTTKQSPFTAKTSAGWIKGAPNADNTVTIYKGVPYAAPPVGELRWKEPQPLTPWADTLACTKFGASPVQGKPVPFLMWSQEFITPAEPISEDALFLNVWTPNKTTAEKLPVLVWIHGGGFMSGSGACPIYDGEALAKEGIVYVSINYRLGVFGFMAHPALTKESSHNASGNYALLDQVAALQWVKDNIAAFGGDPNKVTIAGQSAGSMAVQSIVASPTAKGLFRGAIAESGGIGSRPMRSLGDAEKVGESLSKDINELRALPADTLLARAGKLPFGSFAPIVDGYFIPEDAKSIFINGKQNHVPVLAGWVTGDADLVIRDPMANERERTMAMLQFAGAPAAMWAASNKEKTYIYQFSYVPTDKPGFQNYGAFHTSEVPFALHTLALWDRPWTQTDYDVEKYLSGYWINFVKTGDPNGNGLTQWPAYDKASGDVIDFNKTAEVKKGLYKEELEILMK